MAKVSIHGPRKCLGDTSIFLGDGIILTPKFNITFFITNLMLNIFMLNNFFGKSVFSGETAKNSSGGANV